MHFVTPLPQPRDPSPDVRYRATLRRGGDDPQVLASQDHDTLLDALIYLQQLLPGAGPRRFEDLDHASTFGAIHRHEIYADSGRVTPLYFHQ